MKYYLKEKLVNIVKMHCKYSKYCTETVRRIRTIFGLRSAQNRTTVLRLIKKFVENDTDAINCCLLATKTKNIICLQVECN